MRGGFFAARAPAGFRTWRFALAMMRWSAGRLPGLSSTRIRAFAVRWSLRLQILLPVALLLLAAVLVTTLAAAHAAATRSDRESAGRLWAVVDTLGQSRFPLSEAVLHKIKGLTGAEFAVVGQDGQVLASTTPLEADFAARLRQVPSVERIDQMSQLPTGLIAGRPHFLAQVPQDRPTDESLLYVLYPEGRWRQARWDAIGTPLLVGLITAAFGLPLSVWIADRIARRILRVKEHLAELASRHFVQREPAAPVDELFELQSAANRLSQRLSQLQDEITHTERLRLLAQLAGGIAHHLRNAVTGARLAVQLHRRRCAARDADESLDVAERQLSLTEEQLKGLLALGMRQARLRQAGSLAEVVREVARLMAPIARHLQVNFTAACDLPPETAVPDADAVRAAIINLVSNAIEAAGRGGDVAIRAEQRGEQVFVEVEDTGPGPPAETKSTLFDPFVTSKPEGVGLGLSLARQAAESTGGLVDWARRGQRTLFWMAWPAGQPAETTAQLAEVMAR